MNDAAATRGPRRRRLVRLAAAAIALVVVVLIVDRFLIGDGAARAKACLPYRVRHAALAGATSETGAAHIPDFSQIVVIMMENKECSQVIGSTAAPYLNRLGRQYAVLPDLYGTRHPSFPNYLAITSGSTLGATRDCPNCFYHARNLVDELEAAHISWKAYAEDMPSPCYARPRAGNYAKRHLPFLAYTDIVQNPSRCQNVVPFSQLQRDEQAGTLPRFVWITPNLCDDMHNCGVASGDAFVKRTVPSLLNAIGPRGVIIITWDEGTTNRSCCSGRATGGNIPTLVLGGLVRPHSAPTSVYDSYSILRTIEDAWHLPYLGQTGCPCTPTIDEIWR